MSLYQCHKNEFSAPLDREIKEEKLILSKAIKMNSSLLSQALNEYQTQVYLVNTYMIKFYTQKLPVLKYPLPQKDIETFQEHFLKLKLVTSDWTNDVLLGLMYVPTKLIKYSQSVSDELNRAKSLADNKDLTALKGLLDDIKEELTSYKYNITEVQKSVEDFKNTELSDMKTNLQNIVAQIIADENLNESLVQQLRDNIANLQKEIDQCNTDLILEGFAIGGAGVLGILTIPLGPLAWITFGLAIAGLGYLIDLKKKEIQQKKDEITKTTKDIGDYGTDIAVLKSLELEYDSLVNEVEVIRSKLIYVLDQWKVLADNMTTATQDIKNAIDATQTPDFELVKTDIDVAIQEWNNIVSNATKMYVDASMVNGTFEVGMSPTEINETIDKSTKVDIQTYYKHPEVQNIMF